MFINALMLFLDVRILATLLLLIITIRTFRRFNELPPIEDIATVDDSISSMRNVAVNRKKDEKLSSTISGLKPDIGEDELDSNTNDYVHTISLETEKQTTVSTSLEEDKESELQVQPNGGNDDTSTDVGPSKMKAAAAKCTNASTADTLSNKSNTTAAKDDGNNWRCVCETGFLPPGLLKSFGGMESVVRMSTGQCYHKAI